MQGPWKLSRKTVVEVEPWEITGGSVEPWEQVSGRIPQTGLENTGRQLRENTREK